MPSSIPNDTPKVGLMFTCLVDLFRPSVAFAAIELLEQAGCRVEAPLGQTCCGQPAYNSGDRGAARELAEQTIETFEGYHFVVAPSGSCTAMLRGYPTLFENDPDMRARAEALAGRSYELFQFLVDVRGVTATGARYRHIVTYHDSCSGLRSLGVERQPRRLMAGTEGLELVELEDGNVCCGFGGTFCVKYPEVSGHMVNEKASRVLASGAHTLLGGDLGCLLNIAGRLGRLGKTVRVRHLAEVLAGRTGAPGLGLSEQECAEE